VPRSTVTVVLVNYNSGPLLDQCLRHLSFQTRPPDRILVVDNGSTDESIACAHRYENVRIRLNGANLGFARANNLAVAETDTDYVALLNTDANAQPDWLERLMGAAYANPDVVAFGSRQMAVGVEEIVDGLGDAYHFSGLVWRHGHGRKLRMKDLVAREIFSACGAAALYRRKEFLEAGGFDEDFFCYCEDSDLGFRLRLAGKGCLFVPGAVVYHYGCGSSGGPGSDFSLYHGHRNLVWMFVKNMPAPLFWALLPAHILQNLAIIAMFTLRGQGEVIWRAKKDAVRGLPGAWAKRQKIQATRVATPRQIWKALDGRMARRLRIRMFRALHLPV
jgi:GT2 family glycosyltransferase